MKIRGVVWSLVAIVAAVTIFYMLRTYTPAGTVATTKVAFVTGGDGPFWDIVVAGAKSAAAEYNAVVDVLTPAGGVDDQTEIVSRITADEYDGVAISPLAPEEQAEPLRQLVDSTTVVTYDSDAPSCGRACYIGTNNSAAGRLCAQLVKQAVPDGGKVALLMANFEKDNAVARHEGFVEELSGNYAVGGQTGATPNFELVETLVDQVDEGKCRENIRTIVQQHPDLACLVGMFGYHGAICLDELKDESTAIQLVMFDEDEAVLRGIEEGRIYGTVVQDPFKYGNEAVRMLTVLHRGRGAEVPVAGRASIYLPCDTITKENVADFRKRLNERLGAK